MRDLSKLLSILLCVAFLSDSAAAQSWENFEALDQQERDKMFQRKWELRKERQILDTLVPIGTSQAEVVSLLEDYGFRLDTYDVPDEHFRPLHGSYRYTSEGWVSLTPKDFYEQCGANACQMIHSTQEYESLFGSFYHSNQYRWLFIDNNLVKVSTEHTSWGWK